MTRPFFTSGYSPEELAKIDATVEAILQLWARTPGAPTGPDAVPIARDLAHTWFPNIEALLTGLRAAYSDSG